jgi:hypothetical protein
MYLADLVPLVRLYDVFRKEALPAATVSPTAGRFRDSGRSFSCGVEPIPIGGFLLGSTNGRTRNLWVVSLVNGLANADTREVSPEGGAYIVWVINRALRED